MWVRGEYFSNVKSKSKWKEMSVTILIAVKSLEIIYILFLCNRKFLEAKIDFIQICTLISVKYMLVRFVKIIDRLKI